ncbi:glioma pathogenesis-related protein 1-like [Drosophila montana]|uniref:glioma pathogenesis-related protein 1-like n=1 Tax=Drosophila montana TaxID=40370 RepID=UPI00313ADDFD
MSLLWFCVQLLLHSVTADDLVKENRLFIPPEDNNLMNCDGKFEFFDKRLACPSLMNIYNLRDKENSEMKELLLFGHNGLRNRLAKKLDGCDMLEMSWDNNLAELARRHHKYCQRLIDCDITSNLSAHADARKFKKIIRGQYIDVARSSFFLKDIYSTNFIPYVLSSWYETHIELKFPTKVEYNRTKYYKIVGDNSFTHIIKPQTYQLGCSYAMFIDGLSLICYYYPHIHMNDTILVRIKPKEYQCPHSFPVLDSIFKRICKYVEWKL